MSVSAMTARASPDTHALAGYDDFVVLSTVTLVFALVTDTGEGIRTRAAPRPTVQ